MKRIRIEEGREFKKAGEAIRQAKDSGGAAILLDGRRLVVDEATADCLAEAGVEFAFLGVMRGRIITIQVNDDRAPAQVRVVLALKA